MQQPGDSAHTDEQLLELFVAGDQAAFAVIHGRHHKQLASYLSLRYFSGDDALAEDVVQQVFLKLCELAPELDLSTPLRPWLYSIASNSAIDIKRSRSRRRAVSFSVIMDDSDGDAGFDPADPRQGTGLESLLSGEWGERVRSAIETLPEGDRAAIEAVYFRGQTFSEAADGLGIPLGTLKTRVHRALTAIRCRVDALGEMSEAA